MARFYPLFVRRSDGIIEIVSKGKRKDLNQPTDEQLDQKPDKDGISDFYREVALDENKHLDWRRKLGGMLARELDWKDKAGSDNGYMLAAFPENYRLYEHIKKTEKDGKLEVKSKTHAAGGNDRQDAYLYGHPHGRRKRFRSPGDFFPHLLWLCTDESGDSDNCTCKICSPEDLENIVPGAKVKQERAVRIEPENKSLTGTAMARQSSLPGAKPRIDGPTPVQRPTTAPSAKQSGPTPLPQMKSQDQHIDSLYNVFLYRPGELVWFRRGVAWGLGVILRRWTASDQQRCYQVQPLSHPFKHPPSQYKTGHDELRPWLAWSVPKFTSDGLNKLSEPPRYETADWKGLSQHLYGNGDIEVDGSILAAKSIDGTFSLFSKLNASEPESGVAEVFYNGIYLGAEKIWVGDAVRLTIGSGQDIMVVHSIVDRRKASSFGGSQAQEVVQLIGDVYMSATVAHSNPAVPTPASPNDNPHLPTRLTEDLAFRNARSIGARRTASYWRLAKAQARIDISDVKGRWYEASLLLPILQGKDFDIRAQQGDIQEASLFMNSRGDCMNANRAPHLPRLPKETVRKETRIVAFGSAVPAGLVIKDGVQPPNSTTDLAAEHQGNNLMEIDPRFDTAEDAEAQQKSENVVAGTTLDEFMNLDAVGESSSQMQSYGQQGGDGPGRSGGFY